MSYSPGPTPTILLPSTFYGVQGQEINIYWDSVIDSYSPMNAYQFDIVPTLLGSDPSRQENTRWTIVPVAGNVGSNTVVLNVYQNGIRVATKTCTFIVKAPTTGAVSRKLLVIGDSTTSSSQYLSELLNLVTGSGLTITTVGTHSNNIQDSSGTFRNCLHEGIAGSSVGSFYTGSPVSSPFFISAAFNFAQYLINNSITLASGDWVLVNLGINDMSGILTDATAQNQIATMNTQLNAMITNIKAAVSGIRVGLCLTIPPSIDQDAFGQLYNAAWTQWRYKRNHDMWVQNMIAQWDGQSGSSIYLIPIHANLDTQHNFQYANTALNSRNQTIYARSIDAVHPGNSGYWQISDALYSFLRGQET